MQEQLEQRLKQLKAELAVGQKELTELEAKQASLRETLLRISEAIKVLENELAQDVAGAGATVSSVAKI